MARLPLLLVMPVACVVIHIQVLHVMHVAWWVLTR
jgi:hypothetical protein